MLRFFLLHNVNQLYTYIPLLLHLPPCRSSQSAELSSRHALLFTHRSFPGGSAGNESACSEGDLGSIPGLGRSPGEGMATHSRILAWRVSPRGPKEPDTTGCLSLSLVYIRHWGVRHCQWGVRRCQWGVRRCQWGVRRCHRCIRLRCIRHCHRCTHGSATLPSRPPSASPPRSSVHRSTLYTCVSVPALQIGSSVPFFQLLYKGIYI